MAGVTVSFVADPPLAARVKAIARADGVTPSQAAARAAAVGTLIPPSARRTLRSILTEGDAEEQRQLVVSLTKAIGRVGNMIVERELLANASALGLDQDAASEDDIIRTAVGAVSDYRRA